MKFRKTRPGIKEADLTPMVDVTFQLIAFFMVILNFSEAEQDARLLLPHSELAKPPQEEMRNLITLQIMRPNPNGDTFFIYGGQMRPLNPPEQLQLVLAGEVAKLGIDRLPPSVATVIIRADRFAQTGVVQDVIKECQNYGFERFALRAVQAQADTP
jgi:biopolymer transport protein ExbD